MRDGAILNTEPQGIVGYVTVPLAKWFENLAYS
jgi:hypothetical protein